MAFIKRYWFFFAVLFLPLAIMALVRFVPLQVLPDKTAELKSSCFLRTFVEYDAEGKLKELKDPPKPKPECVGAAPPAAKKKTASGAGNQQSRPDPPPPGSKDADKDKDKDTDKDKNKEAKDKENSGPGTITENPKQKKSAGRDEARTLVQFRAADVNARSDFGIASGIMQAIALGGLMFALVQLIWSANALKVPDPAHASPATENDRTMLIAFAVIAVICAIALACYHATSESFDNLLMNEHLKNSIGLFGDPPAAADTVFKAFKKVIWWNLLSAYTAAALLLVYLAVLAIPADPLGDAKQRLAGLQFVVLIGAAMFALSAVVSNATIAWATIGLDSETGAELIEVMGSITKLWSLGSSAFLITAIIVGYAAIRTARPPAPDPNTAKDSAVALRTPSGDDFKAFGWIVQFVVALAPIWAPAGLSKIFDLLKTIP